MPLVPSARRALSRAAQLTAVIVLAIASVMAIAALVRSAPDIATPKAPATNDDVEPGLAAVRRALHGGRYGLLQDRWAQVPLHARVQFGQDVAWQGGSMAIAGPLIRDLWRTDPSVAGADWRPQALRTLYLAYARLRIDGQLCRDGSAPGSRLQLLVYEFDALISYGATLPRSLRVALVADAIAGEAATAMSRPPDPYACAGGRGAGGGLLPSELVLPLQARIRAGLASELGVAGGGERLPRLGLDR